MFRVVFLALALACFGAGAWLQTRAPLAEVAEALTIGQALARLESGREGYVRLDASLDAERRVAASPLSEPAYVTCDRVRLVEIDLDAPPEALERLLGCPVAVQGRVSEQDQEIHVELEGPRRWTAPLEGSGRRLWVLSPLLPGGDGTWRAWRQSERFEGWLSRFDDLRANATGLGDSPEDIRGFYQNRWAEAVPREAFAIVPVEDPPWRRTTPPETAWVAPVAGSDGRILAWAGDFGHGTAGVAGVLSPDPGAQARGYAEALGAPAGAAVGWLEPQTGAAENRTRREHARTAFVAGAVLLIMAAALHAATLALRWLGAQMRRPR